ncbi:MAG: hypothetical protein H0V94_00100, partial [Actinobacteria bacterium]|nr:hypothetical protein [Actinomycetota bacterium]
ALEGLGGGSRIGADRARAVGLDAAGKVAAALVFTGLGVRGSGRVAAGSFVAVSPAATAARKQGGQNDEEYKLRE